MSDIRMLWLLLLLLLLCAHLIFIIVEAVLSNHCLLPVLTDSSDGCLSFCIPQLVLLELLHQLLVGKVNPVEVLRLLVVGVGMVELDQLDIFLPHTALTGSLRQVQGEEMLGIFARPPPLLLRLGVNQPGQAGPQSVSGRDFQQEDDIGQHLCNIQ